MLVTRRLGEENTPEVITNKIQRKVRQLAEMCGVELAGQPESAPVTSPSHNPDAQETLPGGEPNPVGLPEDDYDADETWQHDNGEEFKEVFALDYREPEHDVTDPQQVPVADREPDDDITVEFIEAPDDDATQPEPVAQQVAASTVQPPVFRAPIDTSDEPVPDPDPAVVPEDDRDLPDISVEFIEAQDDIVPEPQDEMPIPPVPTDVPMAHEVPAGPMRVDEKLQRDLSRDIRKAISINDRFRFQRELFAGSASAMNTALDHIEMMNSYGNAELYFFSQLHWDRDNEVVQDFMTIVRNHFQH